MNTSHLVSISATTPHIQSRWFWNLRGWACASHRPAWVEGRPGRARLAASTSENCLFKSIQPLCFTSGIWTAAAALFPAPSARHSMHALPPASRPPSEQCFPPLHPQCVPQKSQMSLHPPPHSMIRLLRARMQSWISGGSWHHWEWFYAEQSKIYKKKNACRNRERMVGSSENCMQEECKKTWS